MLHVGNTLMFSISQLVISSSRLWNNNDVTQKRDIEFVHTNSILSDILFWVMDFQIFFCIRKYFRYFSHTIDGYCQMHVEIIKYLVFSVHKADCSSLVRLRRNELQQFPLQ